MRGRLVARTWEWNPVLYAPPRYRRACRYEAFIPDFPSGAQLSFSSAQAGVVSDAEQAIMGLNASQAPARAPLARLLEQLVACEVLLPLSDARRNRSWEAAGLLDLLDALESGEPPLP